MLSIWKSPPFDFVDHKRIAAARELNQLLQEQEKLLEIPMGPADMLLYEIRSDQIREMIAQLRAEPETTSSIVESQR